MLLLPNVTRPYRVKIIRLHSPLLTENEGDYTPYRACLRWEFGFTCAFCLLHESDLLEESEGTGLMTIEHLITQASEEGRDLRNRYDNLVYACRFCNRDRGVKPFEDENRVRLLNPVTDCMAHYFELKGDEIVAQVEDPHAVRTLAAYRPNKGRKLRLRMLRREELERTQRFLTRMPKLLEIRRLLQTLESASHSIADSEQLEAIANEIADGLAQARRTLERYRAIPSDRPARCRCHLKAPDLPPALAEQCTEAPSLPNYSAGH